MSSISTARNERLSAFPRRDIGPRNPFVPFGPDAVEQSIVRRFDRVAAEHPNRLAVKHGKERYSYDAFNRAANRLARAILAELGEAEEPVAVFLEHGIAPILAIYAILKAGKFYVPLDPAYPRARTAYMLADSQVRLVLTDTRNLPVAKELADEADGSFRSLAIDRLDDRLSDENIGLYVAPTSLAAILYTSGSTGQPKGVTYAHRNLLNAVRIATNGCHFCSEDRLSLLASCSFGASVTDLFPTLLNGAAVLPFDLKKEGLSRLVEWVAEEEITVFHSVPTTFRHFVNSLDGAQRFPHLRLIKLGGDTVGARDIELFGKPHFREDCILRISLAMSETASVVARVFLDKSCAIPDGELLAGYPIDGTEILLLNDEGKEVAQGEAGEITVRSRFLSPGYWRRPDLTAKKFRADPKGDGLRVYHTGDLGRFTPEGCLLHLGRMDFQVKVRGHRIDTGEVEKTLLALESVKEAIVVGTENPAGEICLVAYIIGHDGLPPAVGALRRRVAQILPAYMVPAAFVTMESLPLTAHRKVDRKSLPPPDWSAARDGEPLAPRDDLERVLAQIWRNVLNIAEIGVEDNFFDLGGDSLQVVRMFLEIERKLGKSLPLATLVEAPTVAQLAEALRQTPASHWPSLVPIQPEGTKRPFFCVHTLDGDVVSYADLARHLGFNRPFYGLRSQGLNGGREPFVRIEEMATHYIEEMRAVQKEGPYLLGGMCMGGAVAFEMAQQLTAQGQEVDLVAMFDTPCPPFSYGRHIRFTADRFYRRLKGKLLYVWRRPIRHLRNLARLRLVEWPSYFQDKLRIAKELTVETSSPRAQLLRSGRVIDAYRVKVDEANQAAMRNYVPRAYRGHILMFLAAEEGGADRRKAWSKYAAGGFETEVLPGDHHDVLRAPAVRFLAAKLKASFVVG